MVEAVKEASKQNIKPIMKILPSLPPNAFRFSNMLRIVCSKTSFEIFESLKDLVEFNIAVRHKPTLDLLSKYITNYRIINEAMIDPNELFIVLTLMKRTPSPGADVEVSENDLLVLLCKNDSI